MSEETMNSVNLESSDGVICTVDIRAVKCSGTITAMLEASRNLQDKNATVPLPKIKGATLLKVVSWAEYHINDPEFIEDYTIICDWDAEFMKVDTDTLIELILAANYLNILGLNMLTCQTVINLIKGKTVEEIREALGIKVKVKCPSNDEETEEDEEWSEEDEIDAQGEQMEAGDVAGHISQSSSPVREESGDSSSL